MRPDLLTAESRTQVCCDLDIITARQQGRIMALNMGCSPGTATLIATAISELARNILMYAQHGEIRLRTLEAAGRLGLSIEAVDQGPGIDDPEQALSEGYSTSGRLGLGLPGVRRLMDEFRLESRAGQGTRVEVRKWSC